MATIRKTILTDMPIVLSIIQYGREKMIASGNSHQWGKLHPSDEQIKMDIEKENSYLVLSDEGSPIATFAFIEGVDSTYLEIEGKGWLNNEHYGTIHRIASVPNVHCYRILLSEGKEYPNRYARRELYNAQRLTEVRLYVLWRNTFREWRTTIGFPKDY